MSITNWSDIPGWTCPRIIELYNEMAKELRPGAVAVECGVAYGKSLAYLASVLDLSIDILAVDIWQTFQGRTTLDRKVFEAMRSKYWEHGPRAAAQDMTNLAIESTAAHDRIEWVQARSEDVPRYLDFGVDFVFLDDHHEEASVYAEIMAWLPKLHSGGVIAGHDVNDHYPGVRRAVLRALQDWSPHDAKERGAEIRGPSPGENGWGGVWKWRKP